LLFQFCVGLFFAVDVRFQYQAVQAIAWKDPKMGALKTRDWKTRNWNQAPNHRGGKRGTWKRGNLKVMESRRCRKCAT